MEKKEKESENFLDCKKKLTILKVSAGANG